MLGHKHIAIIEDDAEMRNLLTEFLHSQKLSVVSFADPLDFLNTYSQNLEQLALVVSDVNLPHFNGLELIARIRTINQHLPVLLISAAANAEEIKRACSIGANAFLQKPFRLAELYHHAMSIIKNVSAGRQHSAV